MRRTRMCPLLTLAAIAVAGALAVAGCGGKSTVFSSPGHATATRTVTTVVQVPAPGGSSGSASGSLGFPLLATKNTTRVDSSSPAQDAAAVALAVFPSAAPGTHPTAVTLAPTDDWQAALAASSLMASPFRAPLLLSGSGSLPTATAQALKELAPTGSKALAGAQVVAVGDVPAPPGLHGTRLSGTDPAAVAAAIDAYESARRGRRSVNVVIASADAPAYAMPAAGYAAESGEPILFVGSGGVPAATTAALKAHHHPHIYVLGPPNVIPVSVITQLSKLGVVKRVSGATPAANSVAFAAYRDPGCPVDAACAHAPGSFGWAIRSPGHGYVLMRDSDPLQAAAVAALSSSGTYGPQLLLTNATTLPPAVLNYFLDYATPGYAQEGPTAAVYNHGWIIGDTGAVSMAVQAQLDSLLEVVPQR